MDVTDLMRQCTGKTPPSKALVKGLAKELDIDEALLNRLADEVRTQLYAAWSLLGMIFLICWKPWSVHEMLFLVPQTVAITITLLIVLVWLLGSRRGTSESNAATTAFTSLRDDEETAACRGYQRNSLTPSTRSKSGTNV
jgi:hypothetical protein